MWKLPTIALLALAAGTAAAAGSGDTPFRGDIASLTRSNQDFRRVLFTGKNVQVVAMNLHPGEDIGLEVHQDVDQCFFFVDGTAETIVAGSAARTGADGFVCVPAGTPHDIRNAGTDDLKLFTTYSPPQHPPGTVHHTKEDAVRAESAKKEVSALPAR